MWNIITSNRILEMKMRREAYRRHKSALKRVKGQVDMTEPTKFSFLATNLKRKQLTMDQQRQIQYANQNLLQKMVKNNSKFRCNSQEHFPKDSLNETQFRKVSQEINNENKKMLARLSDTSSSINFMRLEKEHQLTQRLKSNLKRPRPISGMSTKRTANMRPNSAR